MRRRVALAVLLVTALGLPRAAPAGPPPWELRPYLLSSRVRGEFVLRLWPDPGVGTWALPRKGVRLAVLDHRGAPVAAPVHFEVAPGVPEVIQPAAASPFIDVPLRLDPARLPPAMYTLQARIADLSAWDGVTGDPLRVAETRDLLRINVPPPPRRVPTLTPGQAFLFIAPRQWNLTPRPNTFRDQGAAPVAWGDLELQVLRLDRIAQDAGGRILWFSVDGRPGRVRLVGTWDVASLPNLYPLIEDDRLDALRAKYAGRQVWAYGGFQVHCATGDPIATGGLWTRASSSAVIRAIHRVHAGGIEIGAGGLRAVDASPQAFSAFDPLVVVLAPTAGFTPAAAYGGVAPGVRQSPETIASETLKRCRTLFQMHGDAWDFERTYGLQGPTTMHPDWPPAMLRAVLEGWVVAGMTRDMVVWSKGWPMEYGTLAELRAMPTWLYDAPAPHSFWVRFQGDRVVRFGPGRPP